jgi:hypothetical protein
VNVIDGLTGLGRGLRAPCALCQVMLIERLPNKRFDDRLAADIKLSRGVIRLFQHSGGDVHVNALNRLNHPALPFEKMRYVLALIRLPRDSVGTET